MQSLKGISYNVTATAPTQVQARKAAGLPLTNVARGTYTDVAPRQRIAYRTYVDFIPAVAPYEVVTTVEFRAGPTGLRMVVAQDATYDSEWTQLASIGSNEQFNRLGRILSSSKTR